MNDINMFQFLFIMILFVSLIDKGNQSNSFFSVPLDTLGSGYSIITNFLNYNSSIKFYINIQADISTLTARFTKREEYSNFTSLGPSSITDNFSKHAEILQNTIILSTEVLSKDFNLLFGQFDDNDLALSYNTIKDKDSLINNLYRNKLIKDKVFSFNKMERDVLYFGKPINEKKYSGNCKIRNNQWACQMINVYVGAQSYNAKSNVVFDPKVFGIYIPDPFFKWLDDIFFKAQKKTKACSYENFYEHYFYLCDCKSSKQFPDLHFGIGNYIYTMTHRDLFFPYEDFCVFGMENLRRNDFIFGTYFIKLFDIEFNFDSKRITFSTNNNIIKYNEKENEINEEVLQFSIICFTIILLAIFIIYFLCIIYKTHL